MPSTPSIHIDGCVSTGGGGLPPPLRSCSNAVLRLLKGPFLVSNKLVSGYLCIIRVSCLPSMAST